MFKSRVQLRNNRLTIPPTAMEESSLQQGDDLYWAPYNVTDDDLAVDDGVLFAPTPAALQPAESILGPTTITTNNRVTIPKELIYEGQLWYGDHLILIRKGETDQFIVLPVTDEDFRKQHWRHFRR